jgi:acyl-homoserine-lactone acylase
MKIIQTALFLLFHILIFSCDSAYDHSGWDTSKVQIARDEFGVPHIFGQTDPDVAYGLAWAHAEDDFETIQKTLLAGKRMLGRIYGQEGAAMDYFGHLLQTAEIAELKYGSAYSEEFKAILEACSVGMNDFALAHPEEILLEKAFAVNTKELLNCELQSFYCKWDRVYKLFLERVSDFFLRTVLRFNYALIVNLQSIFFKVIFYSFT